MKLLTFQAARFAWRPHARSLPAEVAGGSRDDALPTEGSAEDAVVVFAHAEAADAAPGARERTLRHATKHVR